MRTGVAVTVLLAMVLLAANTYGCGAAATPASGKIQIAASIMPLGDFARQVGGDLVTVSVLLPPGADVHSYEPTPQQMRYVETSKLLVLNDIGLEFWADKVIGSVSSKNLIVVDTSVGVKILDVGADTESASGNPHVWMDPTRAAILVGHIRDALIQVDPAHQETYTTNAAKYLEQLSALDLEIAAEVNTWQNKQFISFHAAYRYFADRYGLTQAAVIEEFPGKEPTPQYVADVIHTANSIPARAIFADVQFSPKVAQTIADATGKKVVLLDALGGVAGRATYIETMRYDVAQMATALK